MISLTKNHASAADAVAYGRRAASGMDVTRVVDRTLETLFAAAQDPGIRETLSLLRSQVQLEKGALLDRMADIYAAVYTAEELRALVEFLEGPAGQAMRAKQSDVEARVQRATIEFLQGLVARDYPRRCQSPE